MILDDVAEAPNPQFARLPITDLTGTWRFAWDDDDRGLAERWHESGLPSPLAIRVPYPPESPMSGIADTGFHPVCWYQREIADPRPASESRVLLRFGAVDYRATIWVNGQFASMHEGGSTPFSIDITDALVGRNATAVLTVRVEDDPHDLEQPRGKQDWLAEPHTIFYHRTTGIWQPVWLEVVPAVYIEDIRWHIDRERWNVNATVSLNRTPADSCDVTVELETPSRTTVSARTSTTDRITTVSLDLSEHFAADNLTGLLWSPTHPVLIGARVTVRHHHGASDEVLGYTGLRTVEVTDRELQINGEPIFLRLVLSQGFWPHSHLAAPSRDAIGAEVDLILALGFNGARLHQKAEDPRFLFDADRKGLLLWDEIGNAFRYSDRAIARHLAEWREIVIRDRNHPSIIAWVPFNESWGIDEVGKRAEQRRAVRTAYHLTHALDGSRPVIGNDGWENVAGDIVTAHDYSWDIDHLRDLYGPSSSPGALAERYRSGQRRLLVDGMDVEGRPVILSEFGGVSFVPSDGEAWYGYGTVATEQEFVERLRALVESVSPPAMIAGFCYTQLTDTLQETNGLVDADRRPKASLATIRSIIAGTGARGR